MKLKFTKLILLSCSLISGAALANAPQAYGYGGPQGFKPLNTVAAIQGAGQYIDDMPVTLTGKLGRQVGHEYYEFTDGTGTIVVEIDHELFWGQQLGAGSSVMLYGEADHEGYGVTVDVDMIRPA